MNIDQARGVMIGLAVGDCLGSVFEGEKPVSPHYLEQFLATPPVLLYTDDTAMALSLAESLVYTGKFSGGDMAMRFAKGWQADPHRGYGGAIRSVFRDLLNGVPWEVAATTQFGGGGSFGNGAAMRVAPVAVWSRGATECVQLAVETARITHTNPAGIDGAVVQAVATWNALNGDETDLLGLLGGLVDSDEFKYKLELLGEALERDDIAWTRQHLGNGVAAGDSVLTAQWCHLRSSSFEETIITALQIGGDVDTIAAMAGAVAGARYGYQAIPEHWRGVEAAERLLDLADGLWRNGRGQG